MRRPWIVYCPKTRRESKRPICCERGPEFHAATGGDAPARRGEFSAIAGLVVGGLHVAKRRVRLQRKRLPVAHQLGNFLRRLALQRPVKHWSLTTLREKLIKIGAKVVHHARYVTFQMAEVAVPRQLFRAILDRIRRLRLLPVLARAG